MARTVALTPVPTAAQSAGGTGAVIDLAQATTARLTLTVSAASGTTPSLLATVQSSPDQVTWAPLGVFPAMTAPGSAYLALPGSSEFLRVVWTITGAAPSFTFGVAGVSVLVYCTPADMAIYGAPSDVLAQVPPADLDRYISAATDRANSLIQNHQTLPLLQWGEDLREAVASLAVWSMMSRRIGFDPESGTDNAFKVNRDAAMKFLLEVGSGDAQLADVIDSSVPEGIDVGGVQIYSDAPRGWNR